MENKDKRVQFQIWKKAVLFLSVLIIGIAAIIYFTWNVKTH